MCSCLLNLSLAKRFKLIPASAASKANRRCNSGGIRTINFPLYVLTAIGSGIISPFISISFTASATISRIPANASSGSPANQLKLGNSTHKPTYSWSSSDHVTRYVYRSSFSMVFFLQAFNCLQYLFHLVCLCHSLVILNIDSRVPLPRRFICSVTATFLTGLAKHGITYSTKVLKANPFGIAAHGSNDFANLCHIFMIPLLVLLSSSPNTLSRAQRIDPPAGRRPVPWSRWWAAVGLSWPMVFSLCLLLSWCFLLMRF